MILTPRPRPALTALVAVLSVVLFLAACGSEIGTASDVIDQVAADTTDDADDSTESNDDNADDGGQGGSETATGPSSSGDTGENKTLDEYLGAAANFARGRGGPGGPGAGGGTFDADAQAEEQRLIQQEIQRCMQSQGFEYTPEENTGGLRFFLAAGNEGLSPAEFAETQGFGISTRFDALLEGDVDLGLDDADPNDEYVATLSPGEADAYQLALRGLPPERNDQGQLIDPETGEVITGGRRFAAGGCRGDAQVEVRGDFSALAELADEFDELDERIDGDPRMAEIAREWSACMREAGFTYENVDEARDDINQQFRPLARSLFRPGNGGGGQNEGGQGGGGNRLQALASIELTDEQEAELGAIQDREREAAVASLNCSGDTEAEIEAIRARYEAEFVEANREVLDRIGN